MRYFYLGHKKVLDIIETVENRFVRSKDWRHVLFHATVQSAGFSVVERDTLADTDKEACFPGGERKAGPTPKMNIFELLTRSPR